MEETVDPATSMGATKTAEAPDTLEVQEVVDAADVEHAVEEEAQYQQHQQQEAKTSFCFVHD